MTRRAGKRKHRMGSQRMPPSAKPTPRAPTIEVDNLPPKQSASLELQSLVKGWVNEAPEFDQVRRALINKVAKAGLEAADPATAIRAMRAVAQTEQRTKQLQLAAIALQIRAAEVERARGTDEDLPQQVQAVQAAAVQEQSPFEVIQELIKRRDVRAALDYRSSNAAEPSELV